MIKEKVVGGNYIKEGFLQYNACIEGLNLPHLIAIESNGDDIVSDYRKLVDNQIAQYRTNLENLVNEYRKVLINNRKNGIMFGKDLEQYKNFARAEKDKIYCKMVEMRYVFFNEHDDERGRALNKLQTTYLANTTELRKKIYDVKQNSIDATYDILKVFREQLYDVFSEVEYKDFICSFQKKQNCSNETGLQRHEIAVIERKQTRYNKEIIASLAVIGLITLRNQCGIYGIELPIEILNSVNAFIANTHIGEGLLFANMFKNLLNKARVEKQTLLALNAMNNSEDNVLRLN